MPILETTQPIFPLQDCIYQELIDIQPSIPSTANETSFFLLQHQPLNFIRTELRGKGDQKQPSCSGKLCDRKDKYRSNNACGCFKADPNLSSGVIETSIISQHFKIPNNRSLRLTNLFMKNADLLARLNPTERALHKDTLRNQVKQAAEYINNFGGFTVAGYANRGESQDASDPNDKVASERVIFHLSYCFPTNQAIPKQPAFQTLVYDYTTQEIPAQDGNLVTLEN
jgi:hypothetical protein